MPTYEYECAACSHHLEAFQPMSAKPLKKCPACGKRRLQRKIGGGAALIFKGPGFYITDYRSSDYKNRAEAESKAASAPAGESKPAPASATDSKAAVPAQAANAVAASESKGDSPSKNTTESKSKSGAPAGSEACPARGRRDSSMRKPGAGVNRAWKDRK